MTERRKPRLLIIGHARHGKDTVAEMIAETMDLKFVSSSRFVAEECIWPTWGHERYPTIDAMFEDRVNHRALWSNLILAYNTPDLTRTVTTMYARGYDIYVGMRNRSEFDACAANKVFDYVIWVDRSQHLPPEDSSSMQLDESLAYWTIDNNGNMQDLNKQILILQEKLHEDGFDVNMYPIDIPEPVEETEHNRTWYDAPENAIQVLDHGFFVVREVMGSDKAIAEAARMSYGRGTKKVNTDAGLINYLVRNYHTSPLEMGEIRFHMRLPIFVMRQLVRHRTANLNEYSGRYSEMVRLFYIPELDQICTQDKVNKQGSAEPVDPELARGVQLHMESVCNTAFDCYEAMLANGVSRETARIVLPLNTYTEVVWKMDISNILKFLTLRDDPHAQPEIRVYAKLIAEAVQHFFPLTYAAYERERQSLKLTPLQIESLIRGEVVEGLSKSEAHQVRQLLEEA